MFAQANIQRLPLRDEMVDMIFTDPPYSRQYLPCYKWLASEAARVLKSGGFVFAMAGEYWINHIFAMFDAQPALSYFWRFTHLSLSGDAPYIWNRKVVAHAKSILAYAKGPGPHKPRVGGVHGAYTGRKDKRFHRWGQDVDSARYYIDCFSAPGDLILDPFLGGGTTAEACELIGRKWIGFDIDWYAIQTAATRLANPELASFVGLPMFRDLQVDHGIQTIAPH